MRLGVLTSIDVRHRYFAHRLRAAFDVVSVVYEQIGYSASAAGVGDLTPDDRRIVESHFAQRNQQERVFFGDQSEFIKPGEECDVRRLRPGELNTPDTLAFLDAAGVDTIVVFGTNLIRAPLLNCRPGRMINLHLGLSPYYRGTATNFYPLLNEEPEYVGATIHLIDASIDGGAILKHARPRIVADDGPHTIGCKAIVAGVEKLIDVLIAVDQGHLTPVPQWGVPAARLYLRKDYHPRQVVELYRKLEGGLIPRYVSRAAGVAARVRLIE